MKKFVPFNFSVKDKRDRKLLEKTVAEFFSNEKVQMETKLEECKIQTLNNIDMFKHTYRSINKSAISRNIDYESKFSPGSTILENCLHCEFSGETGPSEKKAACFYGDGYYHNIFSLDSMPKTDTVPFIANKTLLNNELINFSITVNVQRLDKEKIIVKKQNQRAQLISTREAEKKEVALDAPLWICMIKSSG